jgi:protein-disulfide isomerase
MNIDNFLLLSKKIQSMTFWIVGLTIFIGFILSILSWLELCVEHCSANQDYRFFGLPFAPVGIAFFAVMFLLHLFSRQYDALSQLVGWMVASGLGAEVMFIAVQKYQIGNWCPVCLGIAFCLIIAGATLGIGYIRKLYLTIRNSNRGEIMSRIKKGFASVSFFMIGFLFAFIGVSKVDFAQAEVNDMKNRMVFGNKNSPIEVYFVTDWFCPSCKKIEPQIEELLPKIETKAAFYFIDYPIHTKSLNFCPYNLAFLLHNKPQYFKARQLLTQLAEKTDKPKDADVEEAAQQAGIPFKELTFLEVKSGMDYFDKIVQEYKLDSTPTIIIKNIKTKKSAKFEGTDEISQEKVLKAIEKLSK